MKRSPSAGSPLTDRRPHLNLHALPLLGWRSRTRARRLGLLVALLAGTFSCRRPRTRAGPSSSASSRGSSTRRANSMPAIEGDGRERSAHESLRARLEVGRAGPGTYNWGTVGPLHRRPGLARDPGRARSYGDRPAGWQATRGSPPIDSAAHKQRLGELPQGGGRPLRARGLVLEQRLPPAIRGERHPDADPLMAGVERAQSEEVLQPRGLGLPDRPSVRAPAEDLPRRDQEPGPDGPDRPRRKSRAIRRTEASRPGCSSTAYTGRPGSRTSSTSLALHPYASTVYDFAAGGPDASTSVMKRHGDGATPLWLTEFGWGSAPPRPVRHQPGARRPGEVAAGLVRGGPPKS